MRPRLDGLDSLRGMAAVSVAIFHSVVLLDLSNGRPPEWFMQLHIAVPLFFTISAFALCAGYSASLSSWRGVREFYWRRYFRIAPLFYVMATVWTFYTSSYPSIEDVVLNVVFAFNLLPGKDGSLVAAGWSLGVEMLFYVFFPLLLLVLRDVRSGAAGLVASTVIAAAAAVLMASVPDRFGWHFFVVQGPYFVGGILLFHIFERVARNTVSERRTLALLLMASVMLALSVLAMVDRHALTFMGWYARENIIGLLLMPLVLAFAVFPFPALVNRATIFIGTVSYGVYLIHPFVIATLGRTVAQHMAGKPAWLVVITTITTVLSVTITAAAVTYFGFERRVSNFGRPARVE
ncbi:acyltransferase, partial [Mesorhizobium sp. M1A.F.Ca.IN.020.06.1.1]